MDDRPYKRTTVYVRKDLHSRLGELPFNFSAWVNNCLEAMLSENNTELMELLNEERQLRAKLAEVKQRIAMAQSSIPLEHREEAQREYELRKEAEHRDELAQEITKAKPDFFVSGKRFEKYTTAELEAIVKELVQHPAPQRPRGSEP